MGFEQTNWHAKCSMYGRVRRGRHFAIAAAALFLIAAENLYAGEPAVVVKMVDMPASFEPRVVTIKVGETIEWKNVGNSVHHASSDPSMAMKPDDASTPAGAKAFDSGFLRPGDTYSFTFSEPGVYNYVCAPHETSGMTGKIIVVPKDQAAR
jgi:plastocyanin